MKKLSILLFVSLVSFSCIKEDLVYKTFTGDLIYTYLQKDTTYSEFVKFVDKAGMKGMLSAYGSYACLAPNNTAFRKLYRSLGSSKFNFDSLRQGQIDTIARTHIMINKFMVIEQKDGVLPNVNMNGRVVEIKFATDPQTSGLKIMLNDSSQIVSRDNEVYNGVIQGIDRVLVSSNILLPDFISRNPEMSIFSEALELTQLSDSLTKVKDENYHPTKIFKDEYDKFDIVNPVERKYGYTILAESNTVLKSYGINNLQDLYKKAKEIYPADAKYDGDYTDRHNSLNQFIAYHLINKAIYYNKFFYTRNALKGYTPDEFIETMLPERIIRVSLENQNVTVNKSTDSKTVISKDGSRTTINGVYHSLTKLLVYSPSVENMLQNTRIRFDIVSLFPEMINNNIRASEGLMTINNSTGDRFGFEAGYLTGIKISKDTRLIYMSAKDQQWNAYQADEFHGLGAYDLTVRLLPVPPGTYELRFGYSAWDGRSVTQVYIDNKPIGIPLDLRITANDPRIGSILDSQTDDNGFENDKMMRNRGYMKAPTTVFSGKVLRNEPTALRRIIGTFTFTDYAAHTIRYKSVDGSTTKQCEMDYFEFVPKSIYSPASGEPEERD